MQSRELIKQTNIYALAFLVSASFVHRYTFNPPVLANSVSGGIDIGQNVADLDFADDVALVGNCDPDV